MTFTEAKAIITVKNTKVCEMSRITFGLILIVLLLIPVSYTHLTLPTNREV